MSMTFEMFSTQLKALIKEKGFIEPTLPQKLGMPEIMKGSNVLIIAPTGIGKTESAMLPLFDLVHTKKQQPISVLYVTPLRSLNRDLVERLVWWAHKLELDIVVRHGDTSQKERKVQVEIPPHIMITTPETLGGILVGKRMREHLKNVKHVVIDEIHELVESKRGVHLSLALERLRELAGNFQRIGLSATVGSPELVAEFLGENVKIIHAESEKKYNISVECPKPSLEDNALAEDLFVGVTTIARLKRLYDLIKNHKGVLAFTNTRETAEVLSSRLRNLDKELKQEVHHGSLSRERRIGSEKAFKMQELRSLIATSSLELGIDIGSVDLVIQYLSPRQVARLIQRVGRAGHQVGATSKGILLSGEEDLFESAIIASKAMRHELEPVKVHDLAYDVLSTQIIGLALEYPGITDEKIFSIVKRAQPYRNLKKEQLIELLKFLDTIRIIFLNETPNGFSIRLRRKAWTYYFENLSMIPDTVQYKIISMIQGEPIGNLDEEFIAEHGSPGEKFVCSGRAWKIIQVQEKKVYVEPIQDIESAIPAWEGELIPVPFAVAQEVGKLRKLLAEENIDKIKESYNIDSNSIKDMQTIVRNHVKTHLIPDNKNVLIENYKDFVIIHLCGGSLANDTIGKYVAAILSAETGTAVNIKSDPYRIILQTVAKPAQVKKLLETADNIGFVLSNDLERSSLFKHRFIHVARRFGILSRGADYQRINIGKIISQYVGSPAYEETLREIFLDKLDVENAKLILEDIKSNKIKLHIQEGLSALGELGLSHKFGEVMKPRMPEEEIFRAFRKRLLTTPVRLLCVNCAQYNIVKAVKDIDDQPECPKCSSRLIAVLRRGQQDVVNLVKKRLKKKELNAIELKEFETAKRSADLVIVYGKKAAVALAGRGVGPETAARILARLHPTKEKFLKDILEAEKNFIRTKPYWK